MGRDRADGFARLATILVVATVAASSLAGAFHSHGLPLPGPADPAFRTEGERDAAGPAGCWACRLSHDQATPAGPPAGEAGRTPTPFLVACDEGHAPLSPAYEPSVPRAPPAV